MKRFLGRAAIALTVLAALLYGAWYLLLRSAWLREQVRARAVTEIEKATGGKVELGKFDFDPALLGASIERFTLRGTEPAGAPPLLQVERVEVGLKILSFVKPNVDVGRIEIVRPRMHVIVDANGKSNLPSPAQARPPSARGPVEQILRLAADAYVVKDAEFSYDAKRYRFSASGRDLQASFDYEAKGPVYRGRVASKTLEIQAGMLPRLPVDLEASLVVEKDAVDFPELRLHTAPSTVTGKGRIESFKAAHGDFALRLETNLTEAERLFHAPAGRGPIESAGRFQWLGGRHVKYEGDLRAKGLDVAIGGVRVTPVAVTGRVVATDEELEVTGIQGTAMEGSFRGKAALPGYGGYRIEGEVAGFQLATVMDKAGQKPIGYAGLLAGPVKLESRWAGKMMLDANMTVTPAEGGVPLEGKIDMRYDRAAGQILVRDSYVTTPHARLDLAGTMSQTLRVKLAATELGDLQPGLKFAGVEREIPVVLEKGSVLFEGTVSGELKSPLIAGQLRAVNARWKDIRADALSTTVLASADKLTLTRFTVADEGATLSGNGTIALEKWAATGDSTIDLRAEGRNLNVDVFRRQAGIEQPLSGLLQTTVQLQGTVDEPRGEVRVDWFRPAYGKEYLDRLRATVSHEGRTLRIASFEATRGGAKATGSGTYAHGRGDWRNGAVEMGFDLAGIDLATLPAVQEVRKGVRGSVAASGKLRARVADGKADLTAVEGTGRLAGLVVDGRPYGEMNVRAATETSGEVQLDAKGTLRGAAITLASNWRLQPGYPGTARLEFGELPFRVFNELRPSQVAAQPWPFTGAFRGTVNFSGPALDIDKWKVAVEIPTVYARPERRAAAAAGQTIPQDFELRNDGPVRFSADGRTVTIRAARFVAKDTNLSASGTFSLAEKRPWDLKVDGRLNLAGVRTFSQDLVATGVATIQATVRGELANPQVFGAMEMKDATLNAEGIPNGLDKVSGRVLFDRRRATIDNRLTAETGGGRLALGGFLDFSGEDTFYRLQAEAASVRIRYPEGVSTVADANLSLSGTTERSLLAGSVTVLRSGFTPRTDFGSLLAESSRGEATPKEANRFLANMQIDVKVRTAPETQFMTSLTNDLEAEANLQIRGTGARPSALGRILISQGDINFFGNKYTIKRGEVSFYNPTKVEPTLDLDLETRVRGVDVTVNFTGPIGRLNVSYRSDPPLQPGEIIALLTVGRSPTSSTVGSSQSGARGSFLESGANSLLGSAISAPISSQLQRFFGVSRIKIDPTIAGLEGTPQARVTVEQQVSKDVTITFVTNLNRSQQQVVRLEWNLNRDWSLIALRDENGSFGVDFQVRKQVK